MAGSRFESGIEVAGGNDGPGTAGAFEFSVDGVRDEVAPGSTGELEPVAALPELCAADELEDAVESSPPQAASVATAPVAITSGPASRRKRVRMGQP